MTRAVLIGIAVLAATSAFADPPASIPDAGRERIEKSFQKFASDWMARAHALEAKQRENPTVRPGTDKPVFTYRGYADDYEVELRPTGQPRAPYVGLLRYTEQVYTCPKASADGCEIASSVPVTEIFRYQDGRWTY